MRDKDAVKCVFTLQLCCEDCDNVHPLVLECCPMDAIKLAFIFSESEYTKYISFLKNIDCTMQFPSASSCVLLTFSKKIGDSLDDLSSVLENLLTRVFAFPVRLPVSGTTDRNQSLMKEDIQRNCKECKVIEDGAGILLWIVGDQNYEGKATDCLKDLKEKKKGRSSELENEDVLIDKCFELDSFQLRACEQLGIVESAQSLIKPDKISLNAENKKIEVRIKKEKWILLTSYLEDVFSEIKESKYIVSGSEKYRPFTTNIRLAMSMKWNFKVLLCFENNEMVLYAKNSEESEKVKNCMHEIFTEKTISTAERMVNREELECAMKSWENHNSFVKLTFSGNSITVYGLTDYVEKVIQNLEFAKAIRTEESERFDPSIDKEEESRQGVEPVSYENFTARLTVENSCETSKSTVRTKAKEIARKHDCGVKFRILQPIPTLEETAAGCTWSFGEMSVIRMNMNKASTGVNFNEVLVLWKNERTGRYYKH